MAKMYEELNPELTAFIGEQKIFFVATAKEGDRVNLSPKGYDSLSVIDSKTVCYLDYPGSGNETAVHTEDDGRITMMFCSFEKKPMILRLYGRGEIAAPGSERFNELFARFMENEVSIVRQIIVLHIEAVMTSCGYGVPFFEYKGERTQLRDWSLVKAKEGGLEKYMGKTRGRPLEG